MWRTSFGGVNDFGLGAAIAVFLFLLVIPVLASTSAASGGRCSVTSDDRRGRSRRFETPSSRAVVEDRPLPREDAGLHRSSSFIGVLWLLPTLGLFFTSLLDPAEIGRRGGGRSSRSRASRPSTTTARSSTTRRSPLRSGRRSGSRSGRRSSRSSSPRSPRTRSPGSSSPGATGCSSSSSRSSSSRSRWR